MASRRVLRTQADIAAVQALGDHRDGRRAAWAAIQAGSRVIKELQVHGATRHAWKTPKQAETLCNAEAKTLLRMRIEAIHMLKHAPHHAKGFRLSRHTGTPYPRPVTALCLISGHEGQEIPGLVAHDRVVVDMEHMEQALGPATVDEIFKYRKRIGEHVYISTNVSETPQIVRNLRTGGVDTRATAALTASKVIAALDAGADIVKVGFANMDPFKRDLPRAEVVAQMRLVRDMIQRGLKERSLIYPRNHTGIYPLVSVFFPEIGIDSHGERPFEIAAKGIEITADGGWQGILIDTFEKYTGKAYRDFYSVADTDKLASLAHRKGIEFWIAGSIQADETLPLVRAKADLICFGGAARHRSGQRVETQKGTADESIKRPLVEQLVRQFERGDPRRRGVARWPYRAADAARLAAK
jgi:uncharacterized protein (UPF0264 family)